MQRHILTLLALAAVLSASAQAAEDATAFTLGREWSNGFEALPDVCTDLQEFQDQYHKNPLQWDAMFGWLANHDLTSIAAGKYPIEGTSLVVSVEDSSNQPLAKRRSESHYHHIDFQYVVRGTERFALIDKETSQPNCAYKQDVIHYDYDPDKALFIDSTPGRFFLFFPSDWHIAKIETPQTDDQHIRVIVVKLDYID